MKKILLAAMLTVIPGLSYCQVPTVVKTTSEDGAGARLAFELKEAVLASKQFSSPSKDSDGRLQITLVTLDPSTGNSGQSTVYSVTHLWNNPAFPRPFYLSSSVGICRYAKTAECAQDLAAEAIQAYEKFLK